jgi:hypothetical protein
MANFYDECREREIGVMKLDEKTIDGVHDSFGKISGVLYNAMTDALKKDGAKERLEEKRCWKREKGWWVKRSESGEKIEGLGTPYYPDGIRLTLGEAQGYTIQAAYDFYKANSLSQKVISRAKITKFAGEFTSAANKIQKAADKLFGIVEAQKNLACRMALGSACDILAARGGKFSKDAFLEEIETIRQIGIIITTDIGMKNKGNNDSPWRETFLLRLAKIYIAATGKRPLKPSAKKAAWGDYAVAAWKIGVKDKGVGIKHDNNIKDSLDKLWLFVKPKISKE